LQTSQPWQRGEWKPPNGRRLRSALLAAACVFGMSPIVARADTHAAQPKAAPDSSAAVRLTYDLKPGFTRRYKVTGIFSGHFPPFAQPTSPPILLRAQLEYAATVTKQDAKGAEVEFSVESADISILEKDPGPDGKIDPDSETPFPLPIEQVQKTLNVTAILRPDGSIAEVVGGDTSQIKIDLGFDLRKLFLLIMPVTFPDRSVRVNEAWTFTDGLLGKGADRVTYRSRLLGIAPAAHATAFRIGQDAQARIDDRRDKDGKPTDKDDAIVDTTKGTVTVTGALNFVTPSTAAPPATDSRAGNLAEGRLTLTVLLNRKRTIPDPDRPDDPLESQIDVRARLFVRADGGPRKASAVSLPNPGADKDKPAAPAEAKK
jgi:hypothetical protein